MKFAQHTVSQVDYRLIKVSHGDGNNCKTSYQFYDYVTEKVLAEFDITGEWERNSFEECIKQMSMEWEEKKKEEIIDEDAIREDKSESPIERELYQALQGVFPGVIIQQHEFHENGRLKTKPDMFLPEHNICIYCDGHEFHERTKEQAKRDRSIDRWLIGKGMKPLRFTGSKIFNDAQKCAEEIVNNLI